MVLHFGKNYIIGTALAIKENYPARPAKMEREGLTVLLRI